MIFVALLGVADANATSTINSTNKYAWGANIGWTNWYDANGGAAGVVIGEFICSGWIWGANVGWINIGNGFPVNNIQYQNNSPTDFGVNYTIDSNQPGYGVLRGFAYGANIGWINFEAVGNPRVRFTDGSLEGYAYSANCGWINLGDPTQHNLKTNTIAMGVDSDGDGMADAFEYKYNSLAPNPLLPMTATTDSDGDGMTDLEEYLEGTNPKLSTDRLRITVYTSNVGGTSSSLTWMSTTLRLYQIESTTDLGTLSTPAVWTNVGLDPTFVDPTLGPLIIPGTGTSTTRSGISLPSSTKRFFRIKAIRPLMP